jgi:hypothetical protein
MEARVLVASDDLGAGDEFAKQRKNRKVRARPQTLSITRSTKLANAAARAAEPDDGLRRLPMVRGDCLESERPCGYVSCRWHLFLDVTKIGNIKINFPHLVDPDGTPRLDEMVDTCALDIADRGGETLNRLGKRMNITRERIRQIVKSIIKKLRGTPAFSEVARLFGLKLDGVKDDDIEITDEILDSFGVAGKAPEDECQDEPDEDEP